MTTQKRSVSTRTLLVYGSLALLQSVLWGLGNPVLKLGFAHLKLFGSMTLRYLLATVLFVLIFRKKIVAGVTRDNLGKLLLISLLTCISFILCNLSLLHTTATTAGFLMSTAVLFVPFLEPFLLRARFDALHLLPVAVILGGLYLLCGVDGVPRIGPGELLALGGALTGAFILVLSADLLREVQPAALATVQSAVCLVFCCCGMLLFERAPKLSAIPLTGWAVITYTAVGCTVLATLIQNTVLTKLSAAYVSLLLCAEPIFSALGGRVLLQETLSARGLWGAALILAAIVLSSLLQSRGAEESAEEKRAA